MFTENPSTRSRLLGTLYGLAVGDALGMPYEFQRRGSYTPSTNMEESHTFFHMGKPLPAGTWTDDTSMALCVAKSIADHSEIKWVDIALNMLRWYKDGYLSAVDHCFDIGNTTCIALEYYYAQLTALNPERPFGTPLPSTFTLTSYHNTSPSASGNGSLMRLSPIPAFFYKSLSDALDATDSQGRITHMSALCVEACRLACVILISLLEDGTNTESCEERKKRVLDSAYLSECGKTIPERLDFKTREVLSIRDGEYKKKGAEDIRTSGFVIHSLEAALWALWNTTTFEEGMLLLLPLGEDVDTVCAIYGQFAGALYGFNAIPERWIGSLQKRDLLDGIFVTLVDKGMAR